jgi:hypothetical protein
VPATEDQASNNEVSQAPGTASEDFFTDEPVRASTAPAAEGEFCREVAYGAEAQPVNLYILLDRSVSMYEPVAADRPDAPSRWEAITEALQVFLDREEVLGAKVGLQFFGLSDAADDCSVAKYETPAVEMGYLSDVHSELINTIASTRPGSLTPTAPALEGALSHALELAQAPENAGRPTVVILASDGLPSECFPTNDRGEPVLSNTALLEMVERFADPPVDEFDSPIVPPIRTHVIGTEELRLSASALARAGRGQAFALGADPNGDIGTDFLEALISIVTKPLACEIPVPTDGTDAREAIDFNRVRVQFRSAVTKGLREIPRSQAGAAGCGGGDGWYYDIPGQPERIVFCPQTCEGLGAGDLSVELGCAPRIY